MYEYMYMYVHVYIYIYMRTFNDVMFAFVSNRVNTVLLYLQPLLIGGHDDQPQDFEEGSNMSGWHAPCGCVHSHHEYYSSIHHGRSWEEHEKLKELLRPLNLDNFAKIRVWLAVCSWYALFFVDCTKTGL